MFLDFNKEFKAGFETENGIIQTGNGIISPIFWFPIKKLLLQNVAKLSLSPSLAGLSFAIYPISTPTQESLSRPARELKFGTNTH